MLGKLQTFRKESSKSLRHLSSSLRGLDYQEDKSLALYSYSNVKYKSKNTPATLPLSDNHYASVIFIQIPCKAVISWEIPTMSKRLFLFKIQKYINKCCITILFTSLCMAPLEIFQELSKQ